MRGVARDIMSPNIVTIRSSMDVREAAKMLFEKQITGAPVVDDHGKLVGVISQTDLIKYDVATARGLTVDAPFYRRPYDESLDLSQDFTPEALPADTVKDVMTPFLLTVEENMPVREVAGRLVKFGVHRLLVVDVHGKPRGVLTSMDVLRWVAEEVPFGADPVG